MSEVISPSNHNGYPTAPSSNRKGAFDFVSPMQAKPNGWTGQDGGLSEKRVDSAKPSSSTQKFRTER